MPKQPYNLEFQPKERRRRDQVLRFLGGFCAIVLLLGIVSAIALQRDGLVDRLLGALRPTEAPTEPPEDGWTHTGSALLLLCGTDDRQQDLRFCALVRADMAQRQIHVFPLSPQAMAPHESGERTLEQALRDGGPKALKAAAEALTEGTVDRYICSTDSGFVTAVNALGSVTVRVGGRIRYRGADFTLTLAEGTQRLQGDMLLRYFRYLGALEEGAALAQGELLARVLETYIAKPMDAKQLDALFDSLMNILHTDIARIDFVSRQELLLDILAAGGKFTIDVRE
ncbi:MAG: LCP family protein [Oscillospiraceae bacterium]|jgi:hypothetical protein|nr:LCP family protein [Oscillospiraceae bacterium]